MRSADPELIGSANGGTGFTQTGDDGRLNFKKGETFSKIFKGKVSVPVLVTALRRMLHLRRIAAACEACHEISWRLKRPKAC